MRRSPATSFDLARGFGAAFGLAVATACGDSSAKALVRGRTGDTPPSSDGEPRGRRSAAGGWLAGDAMPYLASASSFAGMAIEMALASPTNAGIEACSLELRRLFLVVCERLR